MADESGSSPEERIPQTTTGKTPQAQGPDKASQPVPKTTKTRPKYFTTILTLLSDQWFLIGIGLAIAIASQVQVSASSQHTKTTIITYLNVSLIFFITGCTLDTRILIHNYSRWKVHLYVQLQCFLVTSAIAFGIVSAAATNKDFMDPGLLVGMIFFSCVATTMSSNVVMTTQANGNRALTVVQTTVGNFVGVFISPALVVMFTSVPAWYNDVLPPQSGHFAEIYGRVLKQLGLSIFVPMVVGQITRYFFPGACKKVFIDWKLVKLSSICMLLIIWSTYDQAFSSGAFDSVPPDNMIFVVFVCLGLFMVYFGIALGSALMWLPRKDVVSVCYCVPAKGPALGVPLSTTIFVGIDLALQSKIQIPIVIYQGIQTAIGSALIGVFRRWIAAGEARELESRLERGSDPEEQEPESAPEGLRRESIETKDNI